MKRFFSILFLINLTFLLFSTDKVFAAAPVNFQTEQIVTDGLDGPSGFEIAPDGRIFVLQRTGEIKIIKNGQLLQENFAVLPSIASGDRGLIGIAFDPEFNISNHYVYFYYTGLDKLNRLVRFDASGDVGQNGPYLIYQTNSPSEELHVGGSIRFGQDGKMYFAVGDNGYPPNAQNLSNPHGKILRINKDGSIPLDNPFYGQAGALPEIWAYGFRNPWRFQFDSVTGRLYGGDVGDFTWEEANLIEKGKNYGWPTFEGYCNSLCGSTITPIYTYNHDGNSAAITGGPIYRATMFPSEYQGAFFFGDYAMGFIKYLTLDVNGYSTGIHDFDLNAGSVVDLKVAPDGSLYYITYWPGRLYRVSYTLGNHIPTANATADDTDGVEPHTVNFSSAGSFDPDGDPITYLWEFGDGTTSTQANPTKTYYTKGAYVVELTVSDGTNVSHAVPVVIQVGIPPTVTISEPVDGSNYKAGDMIHYTTFAYDGAFDINDNNLSTVILLHHGTHVHPFLGPIIGRQGSFTIPTTGEASADTWFEIKTTATNDSGLSTTKSVFIYPIKSHVTLATSPAGLQVNLDGVPQTTPKTFEGVVGFKREISAPTIQEFNGTYYQFERWSDNMQQKHFISVGATDTTYTAIFREVPSFTAQYYNNTELVGTPALTRQDKAINFFWESGSPDPVINTDNFSVRWTKNQYFAAGQYKFITATDDGVRLYIDNQLVIDKWYGGNESYNAIVTLTSGEHEVRMEYVEYFGGATAKLEWELTPDQPVISSDYEAYYFNNITLSGQPVLTRNDTTVDFNWNYTSPDPLVTNDNFSARWTKTIDVTAGNYEFTVTADDGVRLYIDDQLILDKWIDQAATTYTVQKNLSIGTHTIKLEYYEKGGSALVKMDYRKLTDTPPTTDEFNAEYFTNKNLTGPAALIRNDTAINFDWGGGSPDALIPNDAFSARWTKTQTVTTEKNYEFTVIADDGVKLSIDGTVVLDKWIDQPATTYKVNKILTAGNHIIILEYYENGGGALAKLNYAATDTTPPQQGEYSAEYFNNTTLSAPVALTRNDTAINFDWGGGSPAGVINANIFSARWTKTESFEEGTYEFTTTADDGIRVKVDGEIILDKWVDQVATNYTVQKNLTAGNHTVVVEYYENGGGALAKVSYNKIVTTPPTPIPGQFSGEYFNNKTLSGTPILARNDASIDFNWEYTSPDPVVHNDNFSARWTKTQTFEAGTYKFTTISDDGIRVYVDNQLVIDQWNDHPATTHTGDKTLTAGEHVIKIEFYENDGSALAKFGFEKITTIPPTENPFTAEFFNNTILAGPAIVTRQEELIVFDWKDDSPDPLIQKDKFSARFTKEQHFTAGDHTFLVTADDGVRVYVDNQLIIDQWHDQSSITYNKTINLTEGMHTVKIEYYENYVDGKLVFQIL